VARFDATGRVVAVVDGDRMLHRPDLDVLDIDAVVLTARDAKGLGLRATALRGVADPNARQVTLQGQARVTAWPDLGASSAVLPAPIVFEGEDLLVDTALRSLQSTRPVTLTRADSRIQGSALRYEHLTGITDLAGRVTGHYVPQDLSPHTRVGKARSQP
jgi:lipopolysaccharide export system protein LptC